MKVKVVNKAIAFSTMSDEERIVIAEKIFIKYPALKEILKKAEDNIRLAPLMDEPPCLMLTGPSGAGKTTISRYLTQLFPKKITKEGVIVPVLAASIPSPASVKGLATALLASLGDPLPDKGSTVSQTYRLYKMMGFCQVRMVILDELQHFVDLERHKFLSNVADWLKNFNNNTAIPMILMGMLGADRILDANDQLARRFSSRIVLEPFGWGEKEKEDDFRKFLKLVDGKLPFDKSSQLADWETALRIHYATGGVVGKVMELVRSAAARAIQDGQECIMKDQFSKVYEERWGIAERGRRGKNYLNPFDADMAKVQETKVEEPMETVQSIISQLSKGRPGFKKWLKTMLGIEDSKAGKTPTAA